MTRKCLTRSLWTTPAECTYLSPRWTEIRCERCEGEIETDQDLVEKVLNELLFEWSRSQETMKIGTEELGDEIPGTIVVDIMIKGINRRTNLREER